MSAKSQALRLAESSARRDAERVLYDFRVERGYHRHQGPWTCPTCGEAGDFEYGYANQPPQCGCERKVWDEAVRSSVEEARPSWIQKLIKDAALPYRLGNRTFDTFQTRTGAAAALSRCRTYVERFTPDTDAGLWLIGAFGAGKTHLAIATARALIERHLIDVRFVSAADMVAAVRGDGVKWDWGAVDRAARVELLILDDVGQEQPTEFSRDVLYRVIAGRYEQALPTIITSNGGDTQLKERLGGAAVSRLYEMTEPVVVKATDYRQEILRTRQKGQTA